MQERGSVPEVRVVEAWHEALNEGYEETAGTRSKISSGSMLLTDAVGVLFVRLGLAPKVRPTPKRRRSALKPSWLRS